MPNKKINQNKKRQRKKKKKSLGGSPNFFPEAGPGCHIVRFDAPAGSNVLEWEQGFDAEDFEGQDVPDVAFDPDLKTLTLCNVDSETTKVAYVTVYDTVCIGQNGHPFDTSVTTTNSGETSDCLTFIILCPPMTFCHLCTMKTDDVTSVKIESDVQPWNQHPNPDDTHSFPLSFPLQGESFLCTQGEGGHLTHFFSGNLHAVDFRCPIGTPLLAVGNGTVVESRHDNTLTGIAVTNLFRWNSILLKIDTGNDDGDQLFVEYVHIQTSTVKKGDTVNKGDIIGTSGSVGFSPEPHLHFAAYKSDAPDAPTCRIRFQSKDGRAFSPRAGQYYEAESGPLEQQP